ncbi:MAG: hypothetical protein ACUVXF_03995 [Desulfobaccales bacterium]
MQHLFIFFFRLLLAFVAAKLLMRVVGLASPAALIGFTLLIVANLYVFDYLNHRSQSPWRRHPARRSPGASISPSPSPEPPMVPPPEPPPVPPAETPPEA